MYVNPSTPRIEGSLKRSLSYSHIIKITKTLDNNIIWCICDIKNIKIDIKDRDLTVA